MPPVDAMFTMESGPTPFMEATATWVESHTLRTSSITISCMASNVVLTMSWSRATSVEP